MPSPKKVTSRKNISVPTATVEKISAFLSGLRPDLQMFMEDIYPAPRSLSEAYQQAQEASEILYAEGTTSDDESEYEVECFESDDSQEEEESEFEEESCESDDSEAVVPSDFVSEDSEAESCVDSDFIDCMESVSEEDECDSCANCGGPLCEEPTKVPMRFKCYGCHGTGHKMRDCPLKSIRC